MKCEFAKRHTCLAAAVLFVCGSSLAKADNCAGTDMLITQIAETTVLGTSHSITA